MYVNFYFSSSVQLSFQSFKSVLESTSVFIIQMNGENLNILIFDENLTIFTF